MCALRYIAIWLLDYSLRFELSVVAPSNYHVKGKRGTMTQEAAMALVILP